MVRGRRVLRRLERDRLKVRKLALAPANGPNLTQQFSRSFLSALRACDCFLLIQGQRASRSPLATYSPRLRRSRVNVSLSQPEFRRSLDRKPTTFSPRLRRSRANVLLSQPEFR